MHHIGAMTLDSSLNLQRLAKLQQLLLLILFILLLLLFILLLLLFILLLLLFIILLICMLLHPWVPVTTVRRVPWVADGGVGLQIWRLAAIILNKQSWTAD